MMSLRDIDVVVARSVSDIVEFLEESCQCPQLYPTERGAIYDIVHDAAAQAVRAWAADRREELAAMADDPAISDADFRKMALCYRLMPDTSDLRWAEEQAEAVKRGELG